MSNKEDFMVYTQPKWDDIVKLATEDSIVEAHLKACPDLPRESVLIAMVLSLSADRRARIRLAEVMKEHERMLRPTY